MMMMGEPLSSGDLIELHFNKDTEERLMKIKYKEQDKLLVPLDNTVPWYEEVCKSTIIGILSQGCHNLVTTWSSS